MCDNRITAHEPLGCLRVLTIFQGFEIPFRKWRVLEDDAAAKSLADVKAEIGETGSFVSSTDDREYIVGIVCK